MPFQYGSCGIKQYEVANIVSEKLVHGRSPQGMPLPKPAMTLRLTENVFILLLSLWHLLPTWLVPTPPRVCFHLLSASQIPWKEMWPGDHLSCLSFAVGTPVVPGNTERRPGPQHSSQTTLSPSRIASSVSGREMQAADWLSLLWARELLIAPKHCWWKEAEHCTLWVRISACICIYVPQWNEEQAWGNLKNTLRGIDF